MDETEIIDRLCAVTASLAEIVREQEYIIEQHRLLDTDDKSDKRLNEKRRKAVTEAEKIRHSLQPPVWKGESE